MIDDICLNVIPIKMQLKALFDVHVEVCTNGKQGLDRYIEDISKACCRSYFHLILMDLNMPMMSGYDSATKIHEIYDQISKEPGYEHLPEPIIFAVSANLNEDARRDALQSKMVEFLSKPLKKEELRAAVERRLDCSLLKRLKKY